MRFGLFGRPGRTGSHDPGSGSDGKRPSGLRTKLKRMMKPAAAGVVAVALMASPATAFAGIGSGGNGVSGNTGVGPSDDLLYLSDNNTYSGTPVQGWDDASITYMLNQLESAGYDFSSGTKSNITSVCQDAISEAIADTSDGAAEHARVIGLAATISSNSSGIITWGTSTSDFRSRFESNWSALGDKSDDLIGYDSEWVEKVHSKFNSQITETGNLYPTGVSVVCVAVNNNQPPQDYDLTITTTQKAGSSMVVGDTDAVYDVIHASNGGSSIEEKLKATVVLNYDGQPDGYVASKSVSKTVTIANDGDTNSPNFTPSDFGWDHWQEGTYWFDVKVSKQGSMSAAVDTDDRESSETFRVSAVPPDDPEKTIEDGVSASQMTNTTTITTGTGRGGYELTFKDTIDPNGVDYTVSNMKVTDTTTGEDISSQFTMTWDEDANTVTAVRSSSQGEMPLDHEWAFTFDVTVSLPDDWQNIEDTGTVKWNQEPSVDTDSYEFPTWRPQPDKSWVLLGSDGEWDAVIDPDWTNQTGGDTLKFLDGDSVASVVNGTIGANLIDAPTEITLTDDWSAADYIWDITSDVSEIRVYEATASTDRESSVSDIVANGTDVTDQWTITVDGTVVTATANEDYLKAQQGLSEPKQITLVIPGVINYANGGGAAQVREDFGVDESSELTFCADPATTSDASDTTLTNSGSETVNDHTIATNEPYICGYIPPVEKDVVSEASEGGEQESVDGKVVFPGQRLEYQLVTEPQLPGDLAYTITEVAVTDTYDEYFTPDKQTLEITDLNSGKTISKKQYTTTWDDDSHSVRIVFSDDYVAANWPAGSNPRIMVRFEGTVDEDAPTDTIVDNQWALTLNNSLTPSNKVYNTPPEFTPDKDVTQSAEQGDASISIDGQTLLLGDTFTYRVSLDLSKLDADTVAYKVWRAGIVDDWDEEYLTLDEDNVQVLDENGEDVTDAFNIQTTDGVTYVFAKTVDTEIPATGETVSGDPQPDDLKAYSELTDDDYDPLNDPAIDQSLLGQTYEIVLPMTVTKVVDGTVVENTAVQLVNDESETTNTVYNPLVPLNPSKDVVIAVGGESVDGQSIYLNHTFLYRLDSSTLPASRAYPQVTQWRIVDPLDTTHDKYTGQWAVYAKTDLVDADGNTIAQTGDRIAGSGYDSSAFGGDLFTCEQDADGVITIEATDLMLSIASANNTTDQAWVAYIQCERIAVGDEIVNSFTEYVNNAELQSNTVVTRTPNLTPSIDVEKYDTESGLELGDRDSVEEALEMSDGELDITIVITNTSNVDEDGTGYSLTHLDLNDETIAGAGEIKDIQYPDDWDELVLAPGESVTLTATLTGVDKGDNHTNRVTVTADPIVDCPIVDADPFDDVPGEATGDVCYDTPVSDYDDWNGYRPTAIEKITDTLAKTGSTLAWTGGAAAALLALGCGLTVLRRRHATAPAHAAAPAAGNGDDTPTMDMTATGPDGENTDPDTRP